MEQQEYIYTVDQKFFIEALKGSKHPTSHLDRFPEEIYNTSPDSILYKFLYVLIGPVGVGALKKNYLEARLIYEEAGLNFNQLEKFYSDPLKFGKIATETYTDDPESMLNKQIWSVVKAKNQAYKNRVVDFFHAGRLGSTPDGMRFAAKSALGQDVFIIENYQHLFNQNSDVVLDIENFALPSRSGFYNTESFTVIPNVEKSKTVIQKITFDPIPSITNLASGQGSFTVTFGASSVSIPYYRKTVANLISATSTETTSNGYILDSNGRNQITTYYDVQILLNSISSLKNNVKVYGDFENGFEIHMVNQLSNQQVDTLTVSSTLVNQLGYDAVGGKTCVPTVESSSGVLSANNEFANIDIATKRNLETVFNKLKPMTAYPIYQDGQSQWQQTPTGSKTKIYETSHYVTTSRFVTGQESIPWPDPSSVHWIEKSIEVEAPITNKYAKESYQDFHQLSDDRVFVYNDLALLDASYADNITSVTNSKYASISQQLPPEFIIKFPSLSNSQSFKIENLFANAFKPRTASVLEDYTETPLIDESYPIDYFDLPGIKKLQLSNNFWASASKTAGSDFIEIDLEELSAVNFIAFEVIGSPLKVTITYDDLDYQTVRNYVEVTPELIVNTDTPISFNKDVAYIGSEATQSPWTYKNYLFTDVNQNMIFTRFIRIEFNRTASDFLINKDGTNLGWPVCIRNLRIGRIV